MSRQVFQYIFLLYARKILLHMLKAKDFPLYLKGFVSPPTVCMLGVSLCNPGQLQICDFSASTLKTVLQSYATVLGNICF